MNTNTVIMSANKRRSSSSSHEDNGTGKKPRKDNNDIIDYGSDDDLPEESIENRLSWRKDDDPFADWKIVIFDIKSSKEITYNVRKCFLADGPRRSEYFVRLFENEGNFSEAQDKTSRIELNVLQTKAFPEFLDYIYSTGQKMSFTTDNATALYSLAKYFGVARLQNEVKKFCLEDMQHVDRCGTYYEHATILQEDSILEPAATFCRDNISQISCNTSRLHYVPDTQFWLDLMKEHAERGTISNLGSRLSGHMARFCEKHAAILSPEIFKQLTDEKYLPENQLHPMNAVVLLDVERHIVGTNANDEQQQQQQQQQDSELSSLQTRCVKAIGRMKDKVDFTKPGVRDRLKKLPASVLYEIIANC